VTHELQRERLLDLHRRMVSIRRCEDEAGRLVGRIVDLIADPSYLTDLA
jgi:TPP-dependent pyruvate/acetoin dehydrogenase alpha subunit